jgi:hypothetical protein
MISVEVVLFMVRKNTDSPKPGREDRYDFIPRGQEYDPYIEIHNP